MKEKIDQFCRNYEIQIVDDQKRRARYHPPRYFTDPLRADIINKDFVWHSARIADFVNISNECIIDIFSVVIRQLFIIETAFTNQVLF